MKSAIALSESRNRLNCLVDRYCFWLFDREVDHAAAVPHQDAALRNSVIPVQRAQKGRLPRAGRTVQHDALAGSRGQINPAKYRQVQPALVVQCEVLAKADGAQLLAGRSLPQCSTEATSNCV